MEQDEDADTDSRRWSRGDVGVCVNGTGAGERRDGEESVGGQSEACPPSRSEQEMVGTAQERLCPPCNLRNDGKLKTMRRCATGQTGPLSALSASLCCRGCR